MNKDSIREYFLCNRDIVEEIKKIDLKKFGTYIYIIFSFYVINLFISSFVEFDFSAKLFNIFWFILIYIIIYIVKHKRLLYSIFYFIFFIFSIVQYFHINIVQKPFGFTQLLYFKEGMTYTNSIISNINVLIILYVIFGIINYIICLKLIKRYLRDKDNTKILRNIVLIIIFLPLLFASKGTFVSTFSIGDKERNDFYAKFNRVEIYETFSDKKESLEMTGLFEYTFREPYLYVKKMLSYDIREAKEAVDNYFLNRSTSYDHHKYTGIFKDNNIIFIMAESIDTWLIDKDIMPTVYELQKNSLNFTNRYAPFYGAGRTLNTEYCLNTGLYVPFDFNIYTTVNNKLKYSLPSMFKTSGYYTSSIHFNKGEFYDRTNMHKSYGYDNSYFLADMTDKLYYNDIDIVNNDEFYNLMVNKDEKFLTFFTTYSAHLPYNKTNTLCKDIDNEEECIKKLAKMTDDSVKILLDKLKRDNLLDDTIIVFATDHYAYGYKKIEEIKGGKDNIHLDKVPFFIWSNGEYVEDIDKYVDTQDILPTILNLFGIEYGNVYIGTDAFSNNHNNYVYFSDNTYIGDIDNISIEEIQDEKDVNDWIIKTDYYK